METRNILVFSALALAAFGCSDAVAPPASLAMSVNLIGFTNFQIYVPSDGGEKIGKLNLLATDMALEEMPVLESGEEGSSLSCKVHELAPGSHEILVAYKDSTEITQFSMDATTVNNMSAAATVLAKGPQTGGKEISGSLCTVETGKAVEGGGEIIAHFSCMGDGKLNDTNNCASAATCDKQLAGDIWVYLKNCSE
jgi:hypothetical protein